jgi:hypothetical protein
MTWEYQPVHQLLRPCAHRHGRRHSPMSSKQIRLLLGRSWWWRLFSCCSHVVKSPKSSCGLLRCRLLLWQALRACQAVESPKSSSSLLRCWLFLRQSSAYGTAAGSHLGEPRLQFSDRLAVADVGRGSRTAATDAQGRHRDTCCRQPTSCCLVKIAVTAGQGRG